MVDKKKVNRMIKIYPIFYGLTADLLFWIAINTLYLTTVKELLPYQVNMITFLGTGIGILFQFFVIKIIRKIGNINSVRIGTILLFLSTLLNIVSNNFFGLLMAEVCYAIGFAFKHMDSVVLVKNLNYLNRDDDFIKIQSRGGAIYSFVTLAISMVSGFLFNINPYIPMYICLGICFVNIVLSYFLYEVPTINKKEEKKIKTKEKVLTKSILLLVIVYGLFLGLLVTSQQNSKLFLQLNMQEFMNLDTVTIFLSIFIVISRIARFISNLCFTKIYNKSKQKTIFILITLLSLSYVLLLSGNFIGYNIYGIWVMSFGFYLYLLIRDPFDYYIKKVLFDNSDEENHDKLLNYLYLSRKICTLLCGLLVSLILMKLSYVYVMSVLLILSLILFILVIKIYKLLNLSNKKVKEIA